MLNELIYFIKENYSTILMAGLVFIVIQSVILFYGSWTYSIISMGIISLLFAGFVYYIVHFAHYYGVDLREVKYMDIRIMAYAAASMLALFAVLYFLNYGVNSLIVFSKTGVINKYNFYLWLSVMLVVPTSVIVLSNIQLYQKLRDDADVVETRLSVSHHQNLPIYIDNLTFVNTVNGLKNTFEFDNAMEVVERSGSSQQALGMARNRFIDASGYLIPKNANQFTLSWYSFFEDQYYTDTFPFAYQRFDTDSDDAPGKKHYLQKLFPSLTRKNIDNIHLHFKIGGDVDIYMIRDRYRMQINHYTKVEHEALDKKKRANFQDSYLRHIDDKPTKKEYLALEGDEKLTNDMQQITRVGIFQPAWSMSFHGVEINKNIRIRDAALNRYSISTKHLAKREKRPLPAKIRINNEMEIMIDTLTLHDRLQSPGFDQGIDFELVLNKINARDVQLIIKSSTETQQFDKVSATKQK